MEMTEVVTFRQGDLHCASFSAFEEMRKTGELCDVTMKVQGYSFTAHRVVLAAGIPYFRSVFSSSRRETEEKEISLGDLDPKALGSLIDFAYSSEVNISMENVSSLLQASILFQLNKVHDACIEFLSQRIDDRNVVGMRELALSLDNYNLIESCNKFIRDNFEELSKSEIFLNLPHPCVRKIIADDDLRVSHEESVFEALIDWVKSSPAERHAVLPELLAEVRMVHVPADYLIERVYSEELIRTSPRCIDLVNEVKNYHLSKKKSMFSNIKTRPRKLQSTDVVTYAISFNCRKNECMVYLGDFVNETWNNISSKILSDCCVCWSTAAVNGKIYIFLKETIQTFDVKTLEWEELKVKHKSVDFSCVLPYCNVIYCFGSDDVTLSRKIRCFDTVKNHWLKSGNMIISRWGAAAANLGTIMYVTGGLSERTFLRSVEVYNVTTRESTEVAPMLTARRSRACAALDGKIYVCGGWINAMCCRSSTAEVYDPFTDKWIFISTMTIKRSSLSLVSHNRKLYAFGGTVQYDYDCLDGEIYDAQGNQWMSCFSAPPHFRRVVSIPSLRN